MNRVSAIVNPEVERFAYLPEGRHHVWMHLVPSRAVLLLLSVLAIACDPSALKTKSTATKVAAETMGEIAASDQRGEPFSLQAAAQDGPVVVIFYRGHW